jgi:hypothetical protein
MYRIELSPGDETVFRSIEELAVAIKRGVVTPRARIFHNASSRWLPIQFHPHYKAAVSMPLSQAALVAGPQAKPLSSLSLELPPEPEPELEPEATLPESALPVVAPKVASAAEQPAPKKKKKARSGQLAGESRSRRRSKPRRQLRIALVGALLIGGAQWVLSVPLFSRTKPALLVDVQQQLVRAHTEAMKRVGSPNSAGMIPVLPSAASTVTPEVLQQPAEPTHRVTTPSFGGTSSIETARVQPAPSANDLPLAALPPADSLAAPWADSTSGKALNGVLRSVSGGSSAPKSSVKR